MIAAGETAYVGIHTATTAGLLGRMAGGARLTEAPQLLDARSGDYRTAHERESNQRTAASRRVERDAMFIAMNRFQVAPGRGEDFERVWRERETYLDETPGFVRFALLRGDGGEYVSHSTWASRQAFEDWTNSEAFRRGHAQGSLMGVLAGPPQISLYDAVLEQEAAR